LRSLAFGFFVACFSNYFANLCVYGGVFDFLPSVDEGIGLNTSEPEVVPFGKLDVAGAYCVEDFLTELFAILSTAWKY